MAAREHYTRRYRCPQCGAETLSEWSEEDHPWVRVPNFGRSCDHVDPPFIVVEPERFSPEVHCGNCKVPGERVMGQ